MKSQWPTVLSLLIITLRPVNSNANCKSIEFILKLTKSDSVLQAIKLIVFN